MHHQQQTQHRTRRFSCVQDFSLSEQHPGLVIYVRSLFYLHQALGYILL